MRVRETMLVEHEDFENPANANPAYLHSKRVPRVQRLRATMSSCGSPYARGSASRVQLLDGGTGEELFRRGMPDDRKIWSVAALVHPHYHDLLVQVHASFLHAGSDYITCNNYGVTPGVGFDDQQIAQLCSEAGRLARRAVDETGKSNAQVCGSLPPLVESYRADRIPVFEDGVRLYSLIGGALLPHVDCFLAETLSTVDEAKMALTGVQHLGKPAMVSFTLKTNGELRSGEAANDAVRELMAFKTSLKAGVELRAVLFNCSLPEAVSKALKKIHGDSELQTLLQEQGVQLGAYANRLTAIPDDWALAESSEPQAMRTDLEIDQYIRHVLEWIDNGAQIIGGCCGIGPEHIKRIDSILHERGLR